MKLAVAPRQTLHMSVGCVSGYMRCISDGLGSKLVWSCLNKATCSELNPGHGGGRVLRAKQKAFVISLYSVIRSFMLNYVGRSAEVQSVSARTSACAVSLWLSLRTDSQRPCNPSPTVQALFDPPHVFKCIRNHLHKVGKFRLRSNSYLH